MEYVSNLTDFPPLSTGVPLNDSYDDQHQHLDTSGYMLVRAVQTVLVPVFFLLGLLGNLLALGCFLGHSLRSTSCCLYMAAKCSSDTAFLAALFVMWLYRVGVDVLNVQGVCQLTVFVSYVSGFTSVWTVLAITYENYIRICRPHLTKTHCTRRVALIVLGVIVVVAAVFYSFALWTNTVLGGSGGGGGGGGGAEDGEGGKGDDDEPPLCMAMTKFKDVLMVMTFIDTVVTLVLPTLIVVPLVLATLADIARAYDRKNRLQDSLICSRSRHFKNSMEAKVARFLLTVSLTFLLLHTPGHLIRLKLLVSQHILYKELTDVDVTLQRLFETFYYFNFCCSLVIFLGSGANFRALFFSMYCGRFLAACSSWRPSPSSLASPATNEPAVIKMRRRRRGLREDSETTSVENSVLRKNWAPCSRLKGTSGGTGEERQEGTGRERGGGSGGDMV